MRGVWLAVVLLIAVLVVLVALDGWRRDTKYEGNMLLTDPTGLAARLVVGVTREAAVRTLLSGSESRFFNYGFFGPDGQFVACNDQQASDKCPLLRLEYVTLRRRTGGYFVPNQTDVWTIRLVFDGSGILRSFSQEYYDGPLNFLGIR